MTRHAVYEHWTRAARLAFCRYRFANQRGAAAVEFAIVLPLLAALALGTVAIGFQLIVDARLERVTGNLAELAASVPALPYDPTGGYDLDADAAGEAKTLPAIYRALSGDWDPANTRVLITEIRWNAGGALVLNTANDTRRLVDEGTLPCDSRLDGSSAILNGIELPVNARAYLVETCHAAMGVSGVPLGSNAVLRATRLMPASLPIPLSCRELAAGGIAADGVYLIDPDGAGSSDPFPAYCAGMGSPSMAGWTMVAAQLEADPIAWDEGRDASYDPSLGTQQSFALTQDELPAHAHFSLGSNFEPDSANAVAGPYAPGDIDFPDFEGMTGMDPFVWTVWVR